VGTQTLCSIVLRATCTLQPILAICYWDGRFDIIIRGLYTTIGDTIQFGRRMRCLVSPAGLHLQRGACP